MIAIVTTTWEVLTQRQWEPFGAVAVMHVHGCICS